MDRIDLQIEIQPVAFDDIAKQVPAEKNELFRTIAYLESAGNRPDISSPVYDEAIKLGVYAPVLSHHIAEAIGYCNLDCSDYFITFLK